MNSSMVKPEKFGHLYLVYHFTIPLSNSFLSVIMFPLKKKSVNTNVDVFHKLLEAPVQRSSAEKQS